MSGTMDQDIGTKRARFIDEGVDVRETFGFGSPPEVLRAVKLYVGSHYGSMLWDLGSDGATQYFNAWSTCVKLTWQVPRATHRYFVDHLLSCGLSSVRVDTLGRYTKFVRGLMSSPSMEVAVMCGVAKKDIRSVTGANIALLREETGLNPVLASTAQVKEKLLSKAAEVPEMDNWRLPCLGKLLTARGEAHYMAEEEEVVRLTSLIDSLCTN